MTLRSLPAAAADNHACVVQVAVGKAHALLLTDEGVLYSWGANNDCGQLGRVCYNQEKMLKPAPVIAGIKQEIIVQIACGLNHCLALTQKGALYAWGHNRAGQLGVDGFNTHAAVEDLAVSAPTYVKSFNGQDGSLCARSCSCGPESSACVTVRGEVYVWGAISYYLIGSQKKYGGGENATVPVCIKSLPKELYADDMGPDQVSLYKDTVACNISKLNIEDDMASLIQSLKTRSSQLLSVLRTKRAEANDRPTGGEDDFDVEELRQLHHDFQNQKKVLQTQMDDLQKQLSSYRTELARVKRELTVCDQQDAALTETARNLEARKDQVEASAANRRTLETKLHDISHFKSSNQRKRLQLLNERDETERQLLRLTQELTLAMNQQQQFDSRTRMIRSLHGEAGNKSSSLDEKGLKVLDMKRRELAATEPVKLAGTGRFNGLHEIVEISDGALHDVSSSLKEVRAAAGSDGAFLEEVLEDNLQIRKEINALIQARKDQAELGALNEEGTKVVEEGLLQFFQEASLVLSEHERPDGGGQSGQRSQIGQSGWGLGIA
ncbi:unnamed protein product [Effrenium voratum]|uniref:Uncharacterized protein n=1 Tax=Effrenium voratum TaxID=2562239 RepID=A0AA36HP72_9DINO|nr:unnamed protein product [Effrenium voratum]CAJ1371964.1 unnamed protein product [Effrenium voratum]|mmetsp:Transcript_78884/g.189367  ORF Transcript_78884/g.189367 Transcript_78884/m.189367 type:complete len:552 (+) Transcript_78884:30-1685(+)|eukprot:CAMPEP_0181447192 /NCGR_PEP_ID=MMETSP1110-20121109/26495_1 /TAXON_ID=174948 /ORGANISM="Symbiodinium sp., Strain CCMP421" /LENGTH=551 /DNA_ID=CAMNT_0023571297 /DNA_START=30 /DNA_END=1685 /DNA_ORIENTATION=+